MTRAVLLSPDALTPEFPLDRNEEVLVRSGLAVLANLQLAGEAMCLWPPSALERLNPERVDYSRRDWFKRDDIRRHLLLMAMRPGASLVLVRRGRSGVYPIPERLAGRGYTQEWAADVSAEVQHHHRCPNRGRDCVGLAVVRAFGGENVGKYDLKDKHAFALVGPANLPCIADADEWAVDARAISRKIGEAQFRKHSALFGVVRIQSGTKHEKAWFADGRSWVFDKKWGNVWLDDKLDQLARMLDLPTAVIKHALVLGEMPAKRLKRCLSS